MEYQLSKSAYRSLKFFQKVMRAQLSYLTNNQVLTWTQVFMVIYRQLRMSASWRRKSDFLEDGISWVPFMPEETPMCCSWIQAAGFSLFQAQRTVNQGQNTALMSYGLMWERTKNSFIQVYWSLLPIHSTLTVKGNSKAGDSTTIFSSGPQFFTNYCHHENPKLSRAQGWVSVKMCLAEAVNCV